MRKAEYIAKYGEQAYRDTVMRSNEARKLRVEGERKDTFFYKRRKNTFKTRLRKYVNDAFESYVSYDQDSKLTTFNYWRYTGSDIYINEMEIEKHKYLLLKNIYKIPKKHIFIIEPHNKQILIQLLWIAEDKPAMEENKHAVDLIDNYFMEVRRNIVQYDKYHRIIAVYGSVQEAMKATGKSAKQIEKYMTGEMKCRDGCYWEATDKIYKQKWGEWWEDEA